MCYPFNLHTIDQVLLLAAAAVAVAAAAVV